ncbi:MAG TPA: 50S ribosomal protein L21e [Candidatus Nanoarchaeia archaeon]|nr:50S ribosomal protein L21e [Candidatus Nanoarchaeia archaeon]
MKRIGGMRRKTRGKMSKRASERGRLALRAYFQPLKEGERVRLDANPSFTTGIYFPRFHGKSGVVQDKRGSCYNVEIKDGGKKKTLLIHPVHLKKM